MALPRVHPRELTIRPWREEDADALGAAIAESLEHLTPWMPWARDEPISPARRRALIWSWERARESGGDETVGIWLGDQVVGGTGLHPRIARGGLEIGYWVHAAHVRRGIATAAAARMLDRAFARPSTTHVEVHHDPANRASAGVPRALGFVRQDAPDHAGHVVWRRERERPTSD